MSDRDTRKFNRDVFYSFSERNGWWIAPIIAVLMMVLVAIYP